MSLYTFADLQIALREDAPNHQLQVFLKATSTWDIWVDHAYASLGFHILLLIFRLATGSKSRDNEATV